MEGVLPLELRPGLGTAQPMSFELQSRSLHGRWITWADIEKILSSLGDMIIRVELV